MLQGLHENQTAPGGEAEGRAELDAARPARAEGQLDELALALRVDAPERAFARLLLAAGHFDEVSATHQHLLEERLQMTVNIGPLQRSSTN